ncbi:MAG TPA: phosphohistidine phosphatase SixA [Anaerolineales bacterium]|jgi:phosphohistidine phosphatase|nr:phosphohistidine phosphatase SixA [Anaerolineales bacterium]
MILYIIRHAIAADPETVELEDSQRPLTSKGRRKMRVIAHGLKEMEIELDLILTSPYVRATQTARILEKRFDLEKKAVVVTDHLAPTGYGDQLVSMISEKYSDMQNIALIGHEPYLSSLVSVLVTGDPTASIVLKKGGICRLSIENIQYGRCAALEWLLSPAQLVEIGG